MALTFGFFNAIKSSDGTYDRVYSSEQISDMFEGLISDGVYESVGDAFIITAGNGMNVQVGTGRVVIDGKWLKNDAAYSITIPTAHATLNRYDAIVCRMDAASRTMDIVVKSGTAATNPAKPAITDTYSVKEKCLAYVYVGSGVTSITQMNITDTRADTSLCGWVTGIVKQVDTSELFLQWQNAYEQYFAEMEAWKNEQKSLFEQWFSALTDQLQINTYVKKYHKVIDIGDANGVFPLDMDGYTYKDTDILFVNVNGITLTEVYDYLLDTSKSPVEIHTNAALEAENILEITVLKSAIGASSTAVSSLSVSDDGEGNVTIEY